MQPWRNRSPLHERRGWTLRTDLPTAQSPSLHERRGFTLPGGRG